MAETAKSFISPLGSRGARDGSNSPRVLNPFERICFQQDQVSLPFAIVPRLVVQTKAMAGVSVAACSAYSGVIPARTRFTGSG